MDTFLVPKIQKRIHVESQPSIHPNIPSLVFGSEFLKPLNLFLGVGLDYCEHLRPCKEASYPRRMRAPYLEGHKVKELADRRERCPHLSVSGFALTNEGPRTRRGPTESAGTLRTGAWMGSGHGRSRPPGRRAGAPKAGGGLAGRPGQGRGAVPGDCGLPR